jgi:hypothetical protein
MKMYVLMRLSYGDFDVACSTPVFASYNKDLLMAKRKELIDNLTDIELIDEIEYFISDNILEVI